MCIFEILRQNRILVFILLVILKLSCTDDFNDAINEENSLALSPGNKLDISWQNIDSVATSRSASAVVYYDDYIYIYGGEDSSGIKGDFLRYQLSTGIFEVLTADTPKAYSTLTEINGKLYLFGGITTAGIVSHELKYYEISTNTWTEITTADTIGSWPNKRYLHIAAAYNNLLIIHGGQDSTPGLITGEIFFLDLAVSPKFEWTKSSDYLVRTGHAATIIGNTLYFFGGYNENTSSYYNDITSYNIDTDNFLVLNSGGSLSARSNLKMANINNNLLIYAGKNATVFFNDYWVYSINTDSFRQVSSGPGARTDYSLIKHDNKLYFYGGYYINSSSQRVYNSELWEYNYLNDKLY